MAVRTYLMIVVEPTYADIFFNKRSSQAGENFVDLQATVRRFNSVSLNRFVPFRLPVVPVSSTQKRMDRVDTEMDEKRGDSDRELGGIV